MTSLHELDVEEFTGEYSKLFEGPEGTRWHKYYIQSLLDRGSQSYEAELLALFYLSHDIALWKQARSNCRSELSKSLLTGFIDRHTLAYILANSDESTECIPTLGSPT